MKILLVQLPILTYTLNWETFFTPPLALGYLKSMAYKENLLKNIDVKIADFSNGLYGDMTLIDYFIMEKPDILCFSCYSWNLLRTFHIIREVKKQLPKVKIIVGGPEISIDNDLILGAQDIDIMVYGEGELTFVELLDYLGRGGWTLQKINGIIFRKNGKVMVNAKRRPIEDINTIPSPYLLGFIKPSKEGYMLLETMRGCPYRCSYCYYGKNFSKIRTFQNNRIEQELMLAKKVGVKSLYFITSVINFNKNTLLSLCKTIEKVDKDKTMCFQTELRAELVDEEVAKHLKSANIRVLEIGLQSTNQVVLSNVNRKNNLERFKRGIRLLKKYELDVIIGIIIGLPGDTKKTIRETINFLLTNAITKTVHVYTLCVLPSTFLRENIKRFGMVVQKQPPYYVLKTNGLSKKEIREIFLDAERIFERKLIRSDEWFPSMITHSSGFYNKNNPTCHDKDITGITKLILDLSQHSKKGLLNLTKYLVDKVSSHCVLWFRCSDGLKLGTLASFFKKIMSKNPNHSWNVIMEFSKPIPLHYIKKIKVSLYLPKNYLDNRYYFYFENGKASQERLFLVFPAYMKNNDLCLIKQYESITNVFLYAVLDITKNISSEIEYLCGSPGTGLLLDFKGDFNGKRLYETLYLLKGKNVKNKIIRFKNFGFQRIWNIEILKYEQPYWLMENILEYDKDFKGKFTGFNEDEVLMDTVEWKMAL